jgi:hypothetical protein
MRNTYRSFVKRRNHWKTNYRWDGNIKIALQGREFGGLDCTQLAQDRDQGTE